jgi:hypothetical protein
MGSPWRALVLLVTVVEMSLTGGNPSSTPTNPYTFSGAHAHPPLLRTFRVFRPWTVAYTTGGVSLRPTAYPSHPAVTGRVPTPRRFEVFAGVALWGRLCPCMRRCDDDRDRGGLSAPCTLLHRTPVALPNAFEKSAVAAARREPHMHAHTGSAHSPGMGAYGGGVTRRVRRVWWVRKPFNPTNSTCSGAAVRAVGAQLRTRWGYRLSAW